MKFQDNEKRQNNCNNCYITYPWPLVQPLPSLVPNPTKNPAMQNPKVETIGKAFESAMIICSAAKLSFDSPNFAISLDAIKNDAVKNTFHFPFEQPKVSFGLTNIELTIPEQPRISPLPSSSTAAERPDKSRNESGG